MASSLRRTALFFSLYLCAIPLLAQEPAPQGPTFRSTVRRVVVDVVVRGNNNKPVHGLTANDFIVAEDGHQQPVLSFDVHTLDTASIALPPNGAHLPTNNFVNIPTVAEHGPLYVILYDMVNMERDDQIDARRQILKFVRDKPAGTRFAIFVRSDDLYLVQGFTDDKDRIYAVLDPAKPAPHVPRVFMMQRNHGFNDPVSMMNVLTQVTEFLDGVPGHKNLIWLAGVFPLALVPRKEDPREYVEQIHAEINVLTRAQVAVYPINVGGVPVNPPGQLTGARPHGASANEVQTAGGPMGGPDPGLNSLTTPDASGLLASMAAQSQGDSTLTDYFVQRALSDATGGHAFYSTNDITSALEDATDIGGNYYSLTYAPLNWKDDATRHTIAVRVNHKGYELSYRRFYFNTAYSTPGDVEKASDSQTQAASAGSEALQSNMKHGAPMLHDLLFSAHIHADGAPARATAEQMAQLASTQGNEKSQKAPAPVDLQKYVVDYRVTDNAMKALSQEGKAPSFEFAAAAYDADSHLLNGIVNEATKDVATQDAKDQGKGNFFRVRQQIDVPTNAVFLRIGVRDKLTNRIGTLEVQLPLAPEPSSPAVTSAR